MNREVDTEGLREFLESLNITVTQFMEDIHISASHIYGMLNGKIKMGVKTQEKMIRYIEQHELDYALEDLLLPPPMQINGNNVEVINIFKKDSRELVASISSREVILDNDFEIESVPPIY